MANGLLSPVEQQTQAVFGMVPTQERLSILPRYSSKQGMIAPQFLYELAKAVSTPIVAMRGQQVTPEEALNVAISTFGGSAAGVAPKGSVRSGLQRTEKGAKKTEFEIANEIAQKNATKMLGLPPNNTAMDRAKALGFDTPVYHATSADFSEFVPNPLRGASFMARTPEGAMRGAAAGTADRFGQGASNRVMPLLTRSSEVEGLTISKAEKKWFDKLPKEASESQVTKLMDSAPKNGYWFVWYDEMQMPDGTFKYVKKPEPKITYEQAAKTGRDYLGRYHSDYSDASTERFASKMVKQQGKGAYLQNDESGLAMAVVDPTIMRSRFAAFDPARVNEADLLAMGGSPLPLGLLGSNNKEKKQEKKPKK
jgi:hypothetical protein